MARNVDMTVNNGVSTAYCGVLSSFDENYLLVTKSTGEWCSFGEWDLPKGRYSAVFPWCFLSPGVGCSVWMCECVFFPSCPYVVSIFFESLTGSSY